MLITRSAMALIASALCDHLVLIQEIERNAVDDIDIGGAGDAFSGNRKQEGNEMNMRPGDTQEPAGGLADAARQSDSKHEATDLTLPADAIRTGRWRLWVGLMLLVAVIVIAAGVLHLRQRAERIAANIAREPSIAVLPFSSDGNDRRDLYFAEGLSVEMHDALAGVPGLKVAARSGLASANRENPDLSQLGKLLGVSAVLQAHVRRDGRRVQVAAKLAETATGLTLWSDKYDREMSNVFAVQTEIADQVAKHMLGSNVGEPDTLRRRLKPTANVSAFDDYLKGVYALQGRGDESNLEDSVKSFTKALSIDPQFARAQAGICRAQIKRLESVRDSRAYSVARDACGKAKEMDPNLGEVSLALGELARVQGNDNIAIGYYNAAMQDPSLRADSYLGLARTQSIKTQPKLVLTYYQRALSLRPGDSRVYGLLGYHYYLIGNLEKAIDNYEIAATLQPDDDHIWNSLGGLYLAQGGRLKAEEAFNRCLAIKSNYGALSNLGTLKYEDGRYADAAILFRRATGIMPEDYRTWGNLADALLANAEIDAAKKEYAQAVDVAEKYIVASANDALAYARLAWFKVNLGERAEALRLISQAQMLGTQSGEVALWSSLVLLKVGDRVGAQAQLNRALTEGVSEDRIRAIPQFGQSSLRSAEGEALISKTLAVKHHPTKEQK